jgi:hypothetical protein
MRKKFYSLDWSYIACFLGGILLVRSFIVPIVQIFGLLDIFGYVARSPVPILGIIADFGVCSEFIPLALNFLRKLPFIGTFLALPYVRDVVAALTKFYST